MYGLYSSSEKPCEVGTTEGEMSHGEVKWCAQAHTGSKQAKSDDGPGLEVNPAPLHSAAPECLQMNTDANRRIFRVF